MIASRSGTPSISDYLGGDVGKARALRLMRIHGLLALRAVHVDLR